MRYSVEKYDGDDDDTWDATDWCYTVHTDGDIVCICATEEEARHIAMLLEKEPYVK